MFTGRVSLDAHPWFVDHAVLGVVLLPGAALVEFALYAGAQLGCGCVEELVLEAPFLFVEGGAVQVQIVVGEPDGVGARVVSIYSLGVSGESELGEESWVRNATGVLVPGGGVEDGVFGGGDVGLLGGVWPPVGAVELDVDGVYGRLAERGLEYGPAFQGLRAAWRVGGGVVAEVSLPSERCDEAGLFGLHPALFDAALHAFVDVFGGEGSVGGGGGVFLPFSWSGVRLGQVGVSSVRVWLSPLGGDAVSVVLADELGGYVGSVRSLTAREVSVEQLERGRVERERSLFCLDWVPVSGASRFGEGPVVWLVVSRGLIVVSGGWVLMCMGIWVRCLGRSMGGLGSPLLWWSSVLGGMVVGCRVPRMWVLCVCLGWCRSGLLVSVMRMRVWCSSLVARCVLVRAMGSPIPSQLLCGGWFDRLSRSIQGGSV